ncbi:PEGA domain-containing protein [Treponema sp. OMZ 840]|uniref:PEGA domain-containing protein n=1 Tax=Treponema sp. OMZ 840 TaxID=244313 RepID=UPI003D8C60C9
MKRVEKLIYAMIVFLPIITLSAQTPKIGKKKYTDSLLSALDIRANVSAAQVYVNNTYRGNTPLKLTDILPGSYKLRIEKDGFYRQEFECTLESGTEYTIRAELKSITGILHIRADEADAELYIDGNKKGDFFICFSLGAAKPSQTKKNAHRTAQNASQIGIQNSEWTLQVSEGEHTVQVKKFGKYSAPVRVYVFRETEVNVDCHLNEAVFELTSFAAQKKRFNPYNPGSLGICGFNFSVTAPGKGILEIYDKTGNLVYAHNLPPFTEEKQNVYWNGRSFDGTIPEQGVYTAYLKTRGENDEAFLLSDGIEVFIDPSLFYPLTPQSASGISSGIVPSLRLMPKGGIYTAYTAGGDFSLKNGFNSAPLFYSFAYTPLRFLETSCSIGTEIRAQSQSPFIVQAALKAAAQAHFLYYGAFIHYGYSSQNGISIFNESGLAAGAAIAVNVKPVCITLSQTAVFGDSRGMLYPFGGRLKTGLSCAIQRNFYAIHLSAAWFLPFSEKGIYSPGTGYCGAEFSYLIPKTICMPLAGLYYTYTAGTSGGIGFRIGTAIFL